MGGIMVRAGHSNDHLIDVLIEESYIKSPHVEKIFRAVDRAEYYLPESRNAAYNGLAWKCVNLHMSAPCVYSTVVEGLCLEPGLSFLNLGSGTGYLSTMIGLILGSNGINHGVEFYQDVIDYANMKLEDFRKYSGAIDEFDYCEPKFIQGNCLCLSPDFNCQYDRIYCGAAVPEQFESYMKGLLKIGGILVMPLNDQLLQIKRISETHWDIESMLPVSFATLIQPKQGTEQNLVQMIEVEPPSLQALSRALIRTILRKTVEIENPSVKKSKRPPVTRAPKKKRALRRLVVPLFESEDSSDDERHVRIGLGRNREGGRAAVRGDGDGLLNFVLGAVFSGNSNENSGENNETEQSTSEDNKMETDTTESAEECDKKRQKAEQMETQKVETHAVIEHIPSTSQKSEPSIQSQEKPDTSNVSNQEKTEDENSLDSINEIHNVFVDVLNVLRRNEVDDLDEVESARNENINEAQSERMDEERPTATDKGKETKKREKFDSGLGDEIIENHDDSSEDEDDLKLEAISSSDEDHKEKRTKRGPKKERVPVKSLKWRRIESGFNRLVADSSSENDHEEAKADDEMRMYESLYTEHMVKKIQELPLPHILKRYLDFYREF